MIILSMYMQLFVILEVNAHELNKINKFMGRNKIYLICNSIMYSSTLDFSIVK